MKSFLEHLRQQTIPHEMVDDIYAAGVRFYDGEKLVDGAVELSNVMLRQPHRSCI